MRMNEKGTLCFMWTHYSKFGHGAKEICLLSCADTREEARSDIMRLYRCYLDHIKPYNDLLRTTYETQIRVKGTDRAIIKTLRERLDEFWKEYNINHDTLLIFGTLEGPKSLEIVLQGPGTPVLSPGSGSGAQRYQTGAYFLLPMP